MEYRSKGMMVPSFWMNAQSFAALYRRCNEVSRRNRARISNEADWAGPKGLGNLAQALAWDVGCSQVRSEGPQEVSVRSDQIP
jgi:hypothetical protein